MQDIDKNNELESIPEEADFLRALAQIESFGKQTYQIASQEKELLISEREQYAKELAALNKRITDRDAEIEKLRKSLVDVQMELSSVRRSDSSAQLEAKQLREQLDIYRVDTNRITETEEQLRKLRETISQLRTTIGTQQSEKIKIERDHKSEMDKLKLKYDQEKVQLLENVKVAEERVRSISEKTEQIRSQIGIAEKEKQIADEELARVRRTHKQEMEKMRNDLAQHQAASSEQDRRFADQQREYERKLALTRSQTEQTYLSQINKLKTELEEKNREISHSRYLLEQAKEDHRREISLLKQDMAKQIDLRAEEIRRQFILGKTSAAEQKTQNDSDQKS